MTTPTPRAQLKALLAQLANIPPAYCIWKREPEPVFAAPAASSGFRHGWLRVSASKRSWVGWDDLRRTDNGDGTFTMNSVGRRQITLGLDYFSLDRAMVGQPGNGGTFVTMADDVLEDVRVKLWHPTSLDTLNGMGLVFENVGDVLPLTYLVNDTELDAAHLDIMVALATVDSATYTLVNGWIQEVTGTGTYTLEDGQTQVTAPLDVMAMPIIAATAGSPIVLQVPSTTNLSTGQARSVSGAKGMTGLNGTFAITVVDGTHVSLNGSSGSGSYTGDGVLS